MDIELERKITEITDYLREISSNELHLQTMDPVARMMLVALLHESEKIQDSIEGTAARIAERFCEHFVPRDLVAAMPAIALVRPTFKAGKGDTVVNVPNGASFVFKTESGGGKSTIEYLPLFASTLLPHEDVCIVSSKRYPHELANVENAPSEQELSAAFTQLPANIVWVGISMKAEVDSFRNVSLFVEGCGGIVPKRIAVVGQNNTELQFCSMERMEDVEMLEPFDAQQATGRFLTILRHWQQRLLALQNETLLCITDELKDRDAFKKRSFPRRFPNWLESEVLDCFEKAGASRVWLEIEFPEGFVVPADCNVRLNVLPVVNVSLGSVTLTQSSPIAKLQKQDDSFFLQIVETTDAQHRQGFSMMEEEVVVRDFEASCYDNGQLYRDVRNLYNRFVEDYYAFIEYNSLKDGEDIRRLKELINKIGKSVGTQNTRFSFDSGTYVMKNINQTQPSLSTKVSFISTQGAKGNELQPSSESSRDVRNKKVPKLECRKMPLLETAVEVIVGAAGGRDKANADSRYEQMRYYALTADRLYTRMDVEAFVRKELITVFGREEFKRILIKTSIEGAGHTTSVRRGLYIDIEFKDEKNYVKARDLCLDEQLLQDIRNKSCIAMPVVVELVSLD